MAKQVKKTRLGKGLGALIPDAEFDPAKGYNVTKSEEKGSLSAEIEIEKIKTNPFQPRREFDEESLKGLAESIKKHGVIQPVSVKKDDGSYILVSGERRLRASKLIGNKTIPAFIMEVDSDAKMIELAIIENVQRENLNPIEVANGYHRLIEECKYTQEKVAENVGKERSTVTNFLRLLRLPETVQDLLRTGQISMGHARTLLGLSDSAKIIRASREIITKNLSVRATEKLVRDMESGIAGKNKKPVQKPAVSEQTRILLEDKANTLRHSFGTQVKINPKNESSGTIEFEFYSTEEFERLIELFDKINS